MSFDPYFIISYLERNFMIPSNQIVYSAQLKKDFGINLFNKIKFLKYLEDIFNVSFPKIHEAERYEYLLDIILVIIIQQDEIQIRHQLE